MSLVPGRFSLPVSPFRPAGGELLQYEVRDCLTVIGKNSFVLLSLIFLKKRRKVIPEVVSSPQNEFAEEIISPVGLT